MSLPPIDLERPCCKCGSKDINTRWVKPMPFEQNGSIKIPRKTWDSLTKDRLVDGEHMSRCCRVCGYRWAEAPLDQCSAIDQLAAKA